MEGEVNEKDTGASAADVPAFVLILPKTGKKIMLAGEKAIVSFAEEPVLPTRT
jgi:hypothetical protein